MALLRMLAFAPGTTTQVPETRQKPVATPFSTSNATIQESKSPSIAVDTPTPTLIAKTVVEEQISPLATAHQTQEFDGNWRALVEELKLGLARALAHNCELISFDEFNMHLSVAHSQKHLLDASYQEKLQSAIQQYFGKKIRLHFAIGGGENTPAQQITQEKAALQSHAQAAIEEDDFVQALVKDFGAQIIPTSIKPLQ